jgi:hypothetical protein
LNPIDVGEAFMGALFALAAFSAGRRLAAAIATSLLLRRLERSDRR